MDMPDDDYFIPDDGDDVNNYGYDYDTTYDTTYDGGDDGGDVNNYGYDYDNASDFVAEIENPALPGDQAYGWKYYSNGAAIGPDGKYYFDVGDGKGTQEVYDPATNSYSGMIGALAKTAGNKIKNLLFNGGNPTKGINLQGLGTLVNTGASIYELFGGELPSGGYDKKVPNLTAVREAVQYDDPNRRPGQGGRRYFSDTSYVPEGGDVAAARTAAQTQAQGIAAAAPQYTAPTTSATPYAAPWEKTQAEMRQAPAVAAAPVQDEASAAMPIGGIDPDTGGLLMAAGGRVPEFNGQLQDKGFVVPGDVVRHADPMGKADKERGLQALHRSLGVEAIRGPGDAMSDSIPTTIDGREPARVANGEAYVRPENVARAGGGDVDQGSSRLYEIMDSLRQQRTGSTKQINPDNPQELRAAYGGSVKRYNAGATVNSDAPGTPAPVAGTPPDQSSSSTLSPWVGDYVTNLLGRAQGAANQPYQAYQGPLTAGTSDLQTQAFAGMSGLAGAGYSPTNFTTGSFDSAAAQQYMNPYLQASLDPQLKELSRQAGIQRLADNTALTKAGAFGGSRQAVMASEGNRNLLDKQQQALAQGYSSAYDKAMAQFNAEQGRGFDAQRATEDSRQKSADFGRQSLLDLANLGTTQRQIEGEGIAADKAQFEEERGWEYQMPQYLKDLLGANLPIGTTTTGAQQDWQSKVNTLLGQLGVAADQS